MECPYCKTLINDEATQCPSCRAVFQVLVAPAEETTAFGYFLKCWKKSFDIQGRARRKEYWYFTLISTLVAIILGVIDELAAYLLQMPELSTFSPLNSLYCLCVLPASITANIRRLHDIDRTGLWMLTWLIPPVAIILLLIFAVLRGTPGPNRFGEDPLKELPR